MTTADELRATTENGCDPELIYRAADELERLHNERGMFYTLMDSAMTDWHPPDEIPLPGTLALLATPRVDDPDDFALLAVYERTPDGWRDDCTGKTIAADGVWWCTEDDLIAHLVPRARLRSNGHG